MQHHDVMAQPPQMSRPAQQESGSPATFAKIRSPLRLGFDLGEAVHRFADLVLHAQVLQRAFQAMGEPRRWPPAAPAPSARARGQPTSWSVCAQRRQDQERHGDGDEQADRDFEQAIISESDQCLSPVWSRSSAPARRSRVRRAAWADRRRRTQQPNSERWSSAKERLKIKGGISVAATVA